METPPPGDGSRPEAGDAACCDHVLHFVGRVRSPLTELDAAPRQGEEGAPAAWIDYHPDFRPAFTGLSVGDEVLVLTWLHLARRDVLRVHPRDDARNPETGVFATRSQDRPNPIGLHPVTVLGMSAGSLRVGPLEAVDGTPVLDVKPQLQPGARDPRSAPDA